MTDSEIIKALECCWECELFETCGETVDTIIKNALSLITRQKAKIERLQRENNHFADMDKMYSEIKSEARREFAERLKETMIQENELYEKCVKNMLSFDYQRGYAECNDRFVWDIDNLLKEMESEKQC